MESVFSETVLKLVFDDEFRLSFLDDPQNFQDKYQLTDDDMEIIETYDLDRIEELTETLSSMEYDFVVAATWCNNTPVVNT